jgi:hypothetical protein
MITTVQVLVTVLALHYQASILTAICVILYVFCRAFSVLQIYSSVQLCFFDNMVGSKHLAVVMRGEQPTLLVLCNCIKIWTVVLLCNIILMYYWIGVFLVLPVCARWN